MLTRASSPSSTFVSIFKNLDSLPILMCDCRNPTFPICLVSTYSLGISRPSAIHPVGVLSAFLAALFEWPSSDIKTRRSRS